MTKIEVDGKQVLFKCDQQKCKPPEKSCLIGYGVCQHTTDLEHAKWTGEKEFELLGDEVLIEI